MLLRPLGDASEVVTLDEAKTHLRVGHDEDDSYITGLIGAATGLVAKITGRVLGLGSWELVLDGFPVGRIDIPTAPLVSVEGVDYADAGNDAREYTGFRVFGVGVAAPGYVLPAIGGVWPKASDEPESVTISFTAGSAEVPDPLKHAILLLIGSWYEHREPVSADDLQEVPFTVSALILPHRVWG